MTPSIPRVTLSELLARYDALYLDAYGVLIDHGGPLPGAIPFIHHLRDVGKPYLVLTNDASRSPGTAARRFAGLGLPIPAERILTSGLLLAGYFEAAGLAGAHCLVLGTDDSRAYVRDAAGIPVSPGEDADVLVICDEMGFPYREVLDAALTLLYRRFDRGSPVHLILANPDLVYPAAPGAYGFTAGAMAILLEAALDLRYPGRGLRFTRLGKPNPPLFEEAGRRLPGRRAIMIGDQLATDILGARRAGIDSALVETGVSRFDGSLDGSEVRPTYLLPSLDLEGT